MAQHKGLNQTRILYLGIVVFKLKVGQYQI